MATSESTAAIAVSAVPEHIEQALYRPVNQFVELASFACAAKATVAAIPGSQECHEGPAAIAVLDNLMKMAFGFAKEADQEWLNVRREGGAA